jgi:hypothetical protein
VIRTLIELEPAGDKTRSRTLGEITVANITRAAGRISDDYAWRIRVVDKKQREIVAYGCLVDSYTGNVVDLVWEVLAEWKSGRPAPIDNHGNAMILIRDHEAFWRKADPDPEPLMARE